MNTFNISAISLHLLSNDASALSGLVALQYLSSLVSEELASVFDDLFVRQKAVWLFLAQSEDLPKGHTKRPNVTGRGELPLRVTN